MPSFYPSKWPKCKRSIAPIIVEGEEDWYFRASHNWWEYKLIQLLGEAIQWPYKIENACSSLFPSHPLGPHPYCLSLIGQWSPYSLHGCRSPRYEVRAEASRPLKGQAQKCIAFLPPHSINPNKSQARLHSVGGGRYLAPDGTNGLWGQEQVAFGRHIFRQTTTQVVRVKHIPPCTVLAASLLSVSMFIKF